MAIASDRFEAITIEPVGSMSSVQRCVAAMADAQRTLTHHLAERSLIAAFSVLVAGIVFSAVRDGNFDRSLTPESLDQQFLNRDIRLDVSKTPVTFRVEQTKIVEGTAMVLANNQTSKAWVPVSEISLVR